MSVFDKKTVFEELLEQGVVWVQARTDFPDLVIPERLREEGVVGLEFGLNMPVPISDLNSDDDGITGTLSFSRVSFLCFVPWGSIVVMTLRDTIQVAWFPDDLKTPPVRRVSEKPTLSIVK